MYNEVMALKKINASDFGVLIELAYATDQNFTGQSIYTNPICYLHEDALKALGKARDAASFIGLKILIYDALRPTEAQQKLWDHTPDENFLAHPQKGSPHSRGVAVDLTLTDASGLPLDMGCKFDTFDKISYHGATEISEEARNNRLTLLGLMTESGWDFFRNEWWHYQLFSPRDYPLINDESLPDKMMS